MEISDRIANWQTSSCVSDIFLAFNENFELFSSFYELVDHVICNFRKQKNGKICILIISIFILF